MLCTTVVRELTALTTEVFRKCAWTNPLHADLFPYIRKMEAEVVSWCVGIFNGGKDACGTMTSGGTEKHSNGYESVSAAGIRAGNSLS